MIIGFRKLEGVSARVIGAICLLFLMCVYGCTKDDIQKGTGNDDGGSSTSDDATDDISSTSFDMTVTVVYSSSSATISGTSSDHSVSTDGANVTIKYTGSKNVRYELSGSSSNGYFKLYSSHKQAIVLDGVSLTNPNGSAINIQGPESTPSKGKRTYVVVNGSNTLADGSTYSNTPSTEDEKGVIFGEGQLIFSGDGSLTVSASGKAGIVSDDYVRFMSSPTVSVSSSAGNGIKANDYVRVSDGSLSVQVSAASKKGISSDGDVLIEGGTTTITMTGGTAYDSDDSEYKGTAGIKADSNFTITAGTLTITNSGQGGKGIKSNGKGYFQGGTVRVTVSGSNYGSTGGGGGWWPGGGGGNSSSSVSAKGIKCTGDIVFSGANVIATASAHEAIESKGTITVTGGEVYGFSTSDDGINSASTFTIEDGYVCGFSQGNDGLDANGNFYIKGGVVYAIGTRSPELGIDANTEGGYKLYVQGGTIVAIGGLENNSTLTQRCYQASSWSSNKWYGLIVGSTSFAFKTPSSGGTKLVVSGPVGSDEMPVVRLGVTPSESNSHFEGIFTDGCDTTGSSPVSLSSYTGGNGGGGGGGWH